MILLFELYTHTTKREHNTIINDHLWVKNQTGCGMGTNQRQTVIVIDRYVRDNVISKSAGFVPIHNTSVNRNQTTTFSCQNSKA